jgi:carbon monoxide dehydrogenase subunit G
MQFSTKEDIEAPIADVFRIVSEFGAFERLAIRRGAEVERVQDFSPPREGMSWRVNFLMRGKLRKVDVKLVEYTEPTVLRFEGISGGIDSVATMELVALSAKRTRLGVVFNMKPKTLSARLLVQSLKLAKSNLTKRFKLRVADYAKSVEDRLSQTA